MTIIYLVMTSHDVTCYVCSYNSTNQPTLSWWAYSVLYYLVTTFSCWIYYAFNLTISDSLMHQVEIMSINLFLVMCTVLTILKPLFLAKLSNQKPVVVVAWRITQQIRFWLLTFNRKYLCTQTPFYMLREAFLGKLPN